MANLSNINNKFLVTTGGDVGIGTTGPTTKLHIDSLSTFPTLTLARSTTHSGKSFTVGISNYTGAGADLLFDGIGSDTGFGFRTVNGSGTQINAALVIAPSGNVGIGTASPQSHLHISTSGTNSAIRLQNDNGSGSTANFVLQTDSSGLGNNGFGIYDVANSSYRLVIDGSGNVGIGTASPNPFSWGTKHLTVESAGTNTYAAIDIIGSGSGAGALIFGGGSGSGTATNIGRAQITAVDGSHLVFYTNGSNSGASFNERMRIDNDGSVRIGKSTNYAMSSPYLMIGNSANTNELILSNQGSTQLAGFDGSVIMSTGGSNNLLISSDNGYTAFAYGVSNGYTSYNEAMRIISTGKVGIGITAPAAILDIARNATKTNTGTSEIMYIGTSNEASNYSTLQIYTRGASAAADRQWNFQTIEQGVANAGIISFQPSGGKVGIATATPAQELDVAGRVTHDGLVLKSGTGLYVDTITTFNITLDFVAGNWVDSGLTSLSNGGLSLGATGTYAIQIYSDAHGGEPYWYSIYWSGIMSWYASNTNQANTQNPIVLQTAGHGDNGRTLEAQILWQTSSGTPANAGLLQLKCSATTSGTDLRLRFRRLI